MSYSDFTLPRVQEEFGLILQTTPDLFAGVPPVPLDPTVHAMLARQARLPSRSGNCRPRPHDLRHSFAVATLLDWCRDGGDIASRMPLLSAYLGHASPEHTYWYYSDSRVIPIPAPSRA